MNVDVRLLQLYYGCSKKFDREHKKNSYAGNDRSFTVSRYIGHIIISLYGTHGGQVENRFPRKANNTKAPKSIFFPRLLFPELSKLSVFGYVK